MMDVGEVLKACRVSVGMSLRDVVRKAGCSKSYLSMIESGRMGPPSEELLRDICAAMGLSINVALKLSIIAWVSKAPRSVRGDIAKWKECRMIQKEIDSYGRNFK